MKLVCWIACAACALIRVADALRSPAPAAAPCCIATTPAAPAPSPTHREHALEHNEAVQGDGGRARVCLRGGRDLVEGAEGVGADDARGRARTERHRVLHTAGGVTCWGRAAVSCESEVRDYDVC